VVLYQKSGLGQLFFLKVSSSKTISHTHTHKTGRTPLDEWSACCAGYYLHSTQQTCMPSVD